MQFDPIQNPHAAAFCDGHAEAIAWACTYTDASGELESCDDATPLDFDDATRKALDADALDFLAAVEREDVPPDVAAEWKTYVAEHGEHSAGFDFALSRNGHGAGFFDRGHGFPALQRFAKRWGECQVLLDADGSCEVA